MQTNQTRISLEKLLEDPSKHFAKAADVLASDELTRDEKHRVLEQWRVDAQALSTAEVENMSGGEPSKLPEVLAALRRLEDGGPASAAESRRWSVGTHKLAGVFDSEHAARGGLKTLSEAGIDGCRTWVLGPDDASTLSVDMADMTRGFVKEVATGAGVGAALGGTGSAVLAAVNAGIVIAAPAAAALTAVGVGALAGVTIAGSASKSVRESDFNDAVREALAARMWCVIVETPSEAMALEVQSALAQTALHKTIDHSGAERVVDAPRV